MHITKLGHCCLVVEITTPLRPRSEAPLVKGDKTVRILTDPGAWSTKQNEVKDIDYVFITHEHQDHYHLESIRTIISNNPEVRIVTNKGVGKLLDAEKIPHELLEHGGAKDFSGIRVAGHGEKHAVIYKEFGQVQNTGYFFADRFFYPGDAFYNPGKPVEILALPVSGPWMKISEAIDYAKAIKPKVAFPVHDGMLKIFGPFHSVPQKLLADAGIRFEIMNESDSRDFRRSKSNAVLKSECR